MKKFIIVVLLLTISLLLIAEYKRQPTTERQHCLDPYGVRVLPFKNEHVEDPVYNAIIANKKQNIPCLIDSITDTRSMKDPRKAPAYANFVVGDTAFFILLHATRQPLRSFLPSDIQKKYDKHGIYAYFSYVSKKSNRKELQKTVREKLTKQKKQKKLRDNDQGLGQRG